jgi:acetyltransferase-like isoleucine patch superfamily enzyme
MTEIVKSIYKVLRSSYLKFKFYYKVNWTKTVYFNFKKFPLNTAKKLPVFFYGSVKFTTISGKIEIVGNVKKGMIGFGQPYEMNTVHKGIAEISIAGNMVFKGHVQFGKDYFVFIGKNGVCEMGDMSSLASSSKIICIEKIVLGDYARVGSESQIIDTNFHQMIDTLTGEQFKTTAPILIGSYNYIGNRVSVMQNTNTPSYCTIASNSLCNKDYTALGENVLIGGIPAKLIRTNITRDWNGEKENLKKWLII